MKGLEQKIKALLKTNSAEMVEQKIMAEKSNRISLTTVREIIKNLTKP